jgi:cytochrome c peroxidase
MIRALTLALSLFASALPASAQSNSELIDKGRALFNDTGLSGGGQWSCASCHPMNGHTNNKTYLGVEIVPDGTPAGRSTPTLWGAGQRQAHWSWAGNIPALETNIRGIIVNRMKGPEPSGQTLAALAAYVRSLPNPPARFLKPDGLLAHTAPADVKRGFAIFLGKGGCMTCHLPASYDKRDPEDVGSGGVFKVPSLRSVSRTAPYFHDGRFRTLEETATFMFEFFKKKTDSKETMSNDELRDLVAFLRSL